MGPPQAVESPQTQELSGTTQARVEAGPFELADLGEVPPSDAVPCHAILG